MKLALALVGGAACFTTRDSWNAKFKSSITNTYESDEKYVISQGELWQSLDRTSAGQHPFIVEFNTAQLRESIISSSQDISYIPINKVSGVLLASASTAETVRQQVGVSKMVVLTGDMKIHKSITQSEVSFPNCETEGTLTVALAPCSMNDLSTITQEFEDLLTAGNVDAAVSWDKHLLPNTKTASRIHEQVVHIKGSCSALSAAATTLSTHSKVIWLEPRATFEFSNEWAVKSVQAGSTSETPLWDIGLTGDDEIIGVSDTGIDCTSCFFYDEDVDVPYDVISTTHRKIVTYITYVDSTDIETDGHGTHVCGSVAGSIDDDLTTTTTDDIEVATTFKGNAHQAKIAFMDIGDSEENLYTPSNLDTGIMEVLHDAGARVMTHSWGSVTNEYDTDAKQIDQFMVDYRNGLLLFAAGNYGEYGYNTVGSPATGKNLVSVGCTLAAYASWTYYYPTYGLSSSKYDFDNVAYFSSRGPTADGRLKPDVMTPGYYTTSAYSDSTADGYHCEVVAMAGTSMASPTMAGNAALIREYFMNGYYPSGAVTVADEYEPTGALLKAMLVTSGQAMSALLSSTGSLSSLTYPDEIQGFGRVQVDTVLSFDDSVTAASSNQPGNLFVVGSYDTSIDDYRSFDDEDDYDLYVFYTTDDDSLRTTLVWTDDVTYIASTASGSLTNDLDLSITIVSSGTGSGTYYPYDVTDDDYGTGDHTNVVEMIDISSISSGSLVMIKIKAYSLTSSSQEYALAMIGSFCLSYSTHYDSGSSGWTSFDTVFENEHSCTSSYGKDIKNEDMPSELNLATPIIASSGISGTKAVVYSCFVVLLAAVLGFALYLRSNTRRRLQGFQEL